ncbi:MAG: protein-methionine-sulfoxide reductase heme-binding subunit MsrQ [Xanthomonadales bacterium]|nr:protein-methionine-sulfoxide reductase heme-binding subunit MsrQ [Xanthomonadales bacterium]
MLKPGSKSFIVTLKVLLWLACLAPLAWMSLGAFNLFGIALGANPVEKLLHECGRWGLKLLLASLAVTPLRALTGWHWLIRFRRLLGLFAFFYLVLHLLVYVVLDQYLDFGQLIEDIIERPYITIGMTGLLLLLPLVVTSTKGMMRRLGSRWQSLHRLVYLVAVLGVWHFYWQVKLDTLEPLVYALVLAVLLLSRLVIRRRRARRAALAS